MADANPRAVIGNNRSERNLQYFKEALSYDRETGILSWKEERPASHFSSERGRSIYLARTAGRKITCVSAQGYIVFNVQGIRYYAHRICFAIENNVELIDLPVEIDHIDACRTNNRPCNLRAADQRQNQQNKSLSRTSASGFKGVTWGKQAGKWRSTISIAGKQKHLGFFECPEDAHAAYVLAAKENFGQFARAA